MSEDPYADAPVEVVSPTFEDAPTLSSQLAEIERLQRELGDQAVREQAHGILMERYGYDGAQAARVLARLAEQQGTEEQTYAGYLVATAPDARGLPRPTPPTDVEES